MNYDLHFSDNLLRNLIRKESGYTDAKLYDEKDWEEATKMLIKVASEMKKSNK